MMDKIDYLGDIYQKLKGSIFLRLIPAYMWDKTYPSIKNKIKDKNNNYEIYELENDVNFEQFVELSKTKEV